MTAKENKTVEGAIPRDDAAVTTQIVKEIVDGKLKWYAAIFGITDLAALLGMVCYVFFFLPGKAAELAENRYMNQLKIADLVVERLTTATADSIARTQKEAHDLESTVADVKKGLELNRQKAEDLDALQKELGGKSGYEKLAQIKAVLDVLERHPDTKKLLEKIVRVETQLRSLADGTGKLRVAGVSVVDAADKQLLEITTSAADNETGAVVRMLDQSGATRLELSTVHRPHIDLNATGGSKLHLSITPKDNPLISMNDAKGIERLYVFIDEGLRPAFSCNDDSAKNAVTMTVSKTDGRSGVFATGEGDKTKEYPVAKK